MEFDKDEYEYIFRARIKRHNEFHNKARIQKRNTTQGEPIYE